MKITLYGICLIVYSIYVMVAKRDNKSKFLSFFTLSIFLYINITIGYVFQIGNQTVAGYFLMTLMAGIWGVPLVKKQKKKFFSKGMGLVCCLTISLLLAPLMKYQVLGSAGWDSYLFGGKNVIITSVLGFEQIKELMKAFAFIFILAAAYVELEASDWEDIINKVLFGSRIVLIYGGIEFIIVYIFKYEKLYMTILKPLFGLKASTFTSSLVRGKGYQLQGLFTEPSTYAVGLFMVMLLVIYQLKNSGLINIKINKICAYLTIAQCLFLMLFSMSFSSILLIFLFAVIWLVYIYETNRRIRNILIILFPLICVGGILAIFLLIQTGSYYGERIQSAFRIVQEALVSKDLNQLYFSLVDTTNDGSSISRLGSSIGTFRMEFVQNPIIGLGVGVSKSYSFAANLLTDLGIVGTFFWVCLLLDGCKVKRSIYFYIVLLIIAASTLFFVPISMFGTDVILLVYLLENIFCLPTVDLKNIYYRRALTI